MRPLIVTLTDFGLEGPYLGQVHAAVFKEAPEVSVINLFADLPAFNPRAAAYLIPAFTEEFPTGTVFLCVVDPGVGSARQAMVLEVGERWFVGPDNGLFDVVCKRATPKIQRWVITYQPTRLSASFHGRDLFAPVACQLARGLPVPGKLLGSHDQPWAGWPDDLFEVVYVDRYGNAMTGVRASTVNPATVLEIKQHRLRYARTFSEGTRGEAFWYENANGLVEFALREASVASQLDIRVGDEFSLHGAGD